MQGLLRAQMWSHLQGHLSVRTEVSPYPGSKLPLGFPRAQEEAVSMAEDKAAQCKPRTGG